MTKDEVVEVIIRALPYAEQISRLDTTSNDSAVRFTWRGTEFRVSTSGTFSTETVEGPMLVGGNMSILLQALLVRVATDKMTEANQCLNETSMRHMCRRARMCHRWATRCGSGWGSGWEADVPHVGMSIYPLMNTMNIMERNSMS